MVPELASPHQYSNHIRQGKQQRRVCSSTASVVKTTATSAKPKTRSTYTTRSVTTKRKVVFSQTCRARFIPKPTPNESRDIWYGEDDFISFRRERSFVRRMAEKRGVESLEESGIATCWGMEDFISQERLQQRRARQSLSLNNVLEAQKMYLDQEHVDMSSVMAYQCQQTSFDAQYDAYERAISYSQWLNEGRHTLGARPPSSFLTKDSEGTSLDINIGGVALTPNGKDVTPKTTQPRTSTTTTSMDENNIASTGTDMKKRSPISLRKLASFRHGR